MMYTRQLEILNEHLIAVKSEANGLLLALLALAILLVVLLVALLALNQRKAYYRAENAKNTKLARQYFKTIEKNAKRITELKARLRLQQDSLIETLQTLEGRRNVIKHLDSQIESMQETIKDYETIITIKDEELNEYDRAHPDAIIKETTKLIDRLRSVLIAKSGELRALKGFLVRHGIDANAAIAEEPEMGASGAPYFSQIAEPDPDANRPEIDSCEVCDQQLSTPALDCEPQEATACC